MPIRPLFPACLAAILAFAAPAAAEPPPPAADSLPNTPCDEGPRLADGVPETVDSLLDSGFISLFNGKDLKGWWENCRVHTADKELGGIWWADSSSGILYSRPEGENGGLLVTNEDFDNYELILDVWPTFGNDGGIFNRVTRDGKCWQTGIDYIDGSGIGGSFNEGDWMPGATLNDDPFYFRKDPAAPVATTWTDFTKDKDPERFGCSPGGCVSEDFPKIWDLDGWNQIRVKFFDGLEEGRDVHMQTWIRKAGAPEWVPVYDAHQPRVTPPGPVALQIHGTGRWQAGSYNLYRNIKIRRLDVNGDPLEANAGIRSGRALPPPRLRLEGGILSGTLAGAATLALLDLRGRVLDRFEAERGLFHRTLPPGPPGLVFVRLTDARGRVALARLSRL